MSEMSDLDKMKKAYEILDLPEDATREQVENRYFILMKRARAEKARIDSGGEVEQSLNLQEINSAYNLVIGLDSENLSTVEKPTKLAHFFHYYKVHVIIGIIIILVAGYTTKEMIDKRREAANTPPANLSVSMFGNFYFADMDVLAQNMLNLMPEWVRIAATHVYVPTEIKNEHDMAMQQKSVIMLMTDKSELYIVDEKNFNSLAFQGAFVDLDQFQQATGLTIPQDKIRSALYEDDESEKPFGINIAANPIFQDIELAGEKPILAIRAAEGKWEDTAALIKQILLVAP